MSDNTKQKQEYVCGFLFNDYNHPKNILLIKKNRPEWQAGKYNGIGGKIEEGELPITAMNREFEEEVGIKDIDWHMLAILEGENFKVYFFDGYDEKIYTWKQMEDEVPKIFTGALPHFTYMMENLRFLIPLAKDRSGVAKPVYLYDEKLNHE